MIEVFIDKKESQAALAALEQAEEKGFTYSLASLRLKSTGHICSDDRVSFNEELILKSDPVDPNQDWGRTSMLGLSLYGKIKNA